jgi:CO/xanthine dehydrogenase FAD-binding subunit
VKPAAFEYTRPETVGETLALLDEHGGDAKVLAGGQSLVPVLNMRIVRPAILVDINRVVDLDNMSVGDRSVRVGALVRQAGARGVSPLVDECLPYVGHVVTRNRGTVGGSIAHADGSAELPLALVAAGGSVVVASAARGPREIAAEEFFVTHYTTELAPDELVVETVWPETGPGVAFEETAIRRGDYALCAAACVARGDAVRVAVGAVVDRPTVLDVDPDAPGRSAAALVEPYDTLHASARYLRHLVSVLVDRAVLAARARVRAAEAAEAGTA